MVKERIFNFNNKKLEIIDKKTYIPDLIITNWPNRKCFKNRTENCELCGNDLEEKTNILKCDDQTESFRICQSCTDIILKKIGVKEIKHFGVHDYFYFRKKGIKYVNKTINV